MGAIYYVLFALLIVLVIAFAAWVMFGQRHMDKIIVLGVDIGMITLCMVLLILCVVLRNKYSFRELNPDYVSESITTVSGGDASDESVPEVNVSDENTPETSASDESAPEVNVSDENAPETSASDESAPEASTPDENTPEESTPEVSTPGEEESNTNPE